MFEIVEENKFQSLIGKVQQVLMDTIMHRFVGLGRGYANAFRERSENGQFSRR